MKNYIYYLSILFATLLVASCENELPFNLKENSPKLVINALLNADSLTNTLYLNLTGRESTTNVKEAAIEVRVNGKLTESLRPLPPQTDNDNQCRFKLTSHFNPGDAIRIDAFTDDGEHHAWAEVIVPKRLEKIINIDTLTVPITQSGYTQNYLRYRITFKDHSNENNFYRLIVDKQITATQYNDEKDEWVTQTYHDYQFIAREDIVLTDGQPSTGDDEDSGLFDTAKNLYGVFDNTRFRNDSYTMTVYNRADPLGYSSYVDNIQVVIRLSSITETEFYYLKALNLIDSDAYDETFNEPIKFPSNVHGGTGILGVSTEVSQTIHIGK